MFGDLSGFSSARVVLNNFDAYQTGFVPSAALSGGIKIAEYESPRPVDRAFYHFNSFTYMNPDVNPNVNPTHIARHVLGLEKSLFQGSASVGVRLPFVNLYGNRQLADTQFADMSVILKLALINEPGGNVFTAGAMLTVPSGQGTTVDTSSSRIGPVAVGGAQVISATYFQAYLAFIRYLRPRLFLHGFSSVLTPSDSRLVTLLANDFGLVYLWTRSFREGVIQGVMPTVELHVNTPLNHRGATTQPIGFVDNVNLTAGCSFLLDRAVLGWAIGAPLTGPRPFALELIGTMNFRF
jgi:hypothetical protein